MQPRCADAYAATLVTSINDGSYVEPNRDTFGAWLDVWLAIIQPTVRPSTWASYEKNVRLHVKPYLGAVELRRLNAADLDRLYQRLLDGGRVDHRAGAGLSPRTVRYVATIIGKALKDAVRKGLIVRSPAVDADPRSRPTAPRPCARGPQTNLAPSSPARPRTAGRPSSRFLP